MSDLIVGLYEDWLWLDNVPRWYRARRGDQPQEAKCMRLMSVPGVAPT
jgi:hypothetical protein